MVFDLSVMGETEDGAYVFASESCALRSVGARFVRDIEPGEILIFSKDGILSRREHCGKKQKKLCVFEYIYFARPDSVIDGQSVHMARLNAGKVLAEAHPVKADLVIGVPDSGLDSALGYARASGIPYGIGLIKNRYIGRTFITPGDRSNQVSIKLSAVEDAVRGKSIVLIDDSIVRGTTSEHIVALLRDAGTKEIHMRVSARLFCFHVFIARILIPKKS